MNFKKVIGLGIFVLIVIVSLGWGCFYAKTTNLTFTNNSAIYVDSVGFTLNNYKYKMLSIAPKSTLKKAIYPDSIRLNGHDLTVTASIFVKDTLFRFCYNYNDLYGVLSKDYRLVLKEDSTTVLISEN
jgi:hypothetical protein